MFLANTLSRPTYLTRSLALSDDHLLQIKRLSSDDPVLQVLHNYFEWLTRVKVRYA